MATYTKITLAEMDEHMGDDWTRTLEGTGTREWTYTRPMANHVTVKVYSSLGQDGLARKVGSDAIRVCAIRTNYKGETFGYIKAVRVHRVEGWRANLTARIETVTAGAQERIAAFNEKYKAKEPEATFTLAVSKMPNGPEFKTKKAQLEWFRDTLAENGAMAYDALLTIYAMQTADEQAMEATTESNGIGFGAYDAEILSSFAKQLIGKREKYGATARLSDKQLVLLHKKIVRYARQYAEIREEDTTEPKVDTKPADAPASTPDATPETDSDTYGGTQMMFLRTG